MRSVKLKENIRKRMDARGLKIAELARLSGTPKQRISDWLAGATVRNLDQLRNVAMALDTTIDELVFGDGVGGKSFRVSSADDLSDEQIFEVRVRRIKKR